MKRALIYSAAAIVLLYAIRAFEYAGIRRVQGGEFEKLRIIFEEENHFDLIVLGSSRAECQYYIPLIDSATGLKSYNLGMTGATMPLIAATFEAYLVHSSPPKYVVLNLDLHSLNDNTDTVYKFPRYFPFLDNEKLYHGLQQRDRRFVFFKWLPFYSMPYFSTRYISNSMRGWMNEPTLYDADYVSGFAPSIPDTIHGDLDSVFIKESDATIPQAVWDAIYRIQVTCKQNNCELIFAVSPLYHRQKERVRSYQQTYFAFADYAEENNIAWMDADDGVIEYTKEFYSDPAHLNKAGAIFFTRSFCFSITQYLAK